MTFREATLKDKMNLSSLRYGEDESVLKSLFTNQSPIMKLWFGVMLVLVVLSLFTL